MDIFIDNKKKKNLNSGSLEPLRGTNLNRRGDPHVGISRERDSRGESPSAIRGGPRVLHV